MPVRLQLSDKARGKYGLRSPARNYIMCSCLWSQYLRATQLSKTWSLTLMNGNEIDMALSFIPLPRGFFGPKGVFAGLGSPAPPRRCRLRRAFGAWWWGRWNSRFVCSLLYLFYWGQIALFVCSRFWWLEIVMEKRITGFWGMFLYGHPFISAKASGCADDGSRILVFKTVCLPGNDLIILIFLTFIIF